MKRTIAITLSVLSAGVLAASASSFSAKPGCAAGVSGSCGDCYVAGKKGMPGWHPKYGSWCYSCE